jgi:phosphatidylglycerol lysyltransferase
VFFTQIRGKTFMLLTGRAAMYNRAMDFIKQRHSVIARLAALAVAVNGLFIIYASLLAGIISREEIRINSPTLDIRLIAAFGLLYLSQSLARQKRAAWLITMPLYGFLLGLNVSQLVMSVPRHHFHAVFFLRDFLVPLAIVAVLYLYRQQFTVRSDIRNFTISLRLVFVVLCIAFIYGVAGFMLLDKRDFHQEINIWEAAHRTIDQFNITTTHSLHPYTYRARLFVDSLTTVSTAALVYSAIAFFQPIKARYSDQTNNRERMRALLERCLANSEDFFKLWPHDKQYIFASNTTSEAAIAYHATRGVALSAGDPVGDKRALSAVISSFEEVCWTNDWLPAFIHITDNLQKIYTRHGYTLQKIGEEAVIDLDHFETSVRSNKYFRQIRNRFEKQHYSFEVLQPPHSQALVQRLRDISDEWLTLPGRTERGFIMAYFSSAYLQQCQLALARDEAGTIQAFLNIVPSIDKNEANFDMLRHTSNSLGNVNDYLMLSLFALLHAQGIARFNLGLSPLSGIDTEDSGNSLISTAMRFLYANGDRFYSFSGLHRFKSKYEPVWKSRYIAYKGGVRGFTRTYRALSKAMHVPRRYQ